MDGVDLESLSCDKQRLEGRAEEMYQNVLEFRAWKNQDICSSKPLCSTEAMNLESSGEQTWL